MKCENVVEDKNFKMCVECRKKEAKRIQEFRRLQKEKNKCRYCAKEIYKNGRCLEHYKKERIYTKTTIDNRGVQNRCLTCGRKIIEEKQKYCMLCRSKENRPYYIRW